MGKRSHSNRNGSSDRGGEIGVASRERVVTRSSAAYVLSGGRGQSAYRLSKVIEGSDRRFSRRVVSDRPLVTSD